MAKRPATYAWRMLRLAVLNEEPMCRIKLEGCTGVATVVDHMLPVRTHPHLEYERANLQGACASCNMAKGAGYVPPPPIPRALKFFD